MKKLLLSALAICAFSFSNAQEDDKSTGGQTDQGSWLIEANTGFGSGHSADTGIRFTSRDGESVYNFGLEGGYFVMDNLAVKAGLGYGGSSVEGALSRFSYKVGAKYYIMGMIPVSADLNGASIEDADENPMYLGLGAGYAWFVGNNVSIEPGLRYNATMNDKADAEGNLQFNIGFALHF
ncbi:hypothetical protein [Pseudofulvibacter geojedonensis]|uniref:Outer membrane protein beta-barrel domain-containing protein n=1 Tax=Pseudofulvibacter geojedonensis TaxID=1123758 RepID=A0ABW3I320_9FLAO